MRTKIQDMCRRPGFPVHLAFSEVDCYNEKMLATLRKKVKEHINSAQLRGQKIMGGLVPHNYVVSCSAVGERERGGGRGEGEEGGRRTGTVGPVLIVMI